MTQKQPPEQQVQQKYEEKLKALHWLATVLSKAQSIKEIAEYTFDVMETSLGYTWAVFSIVENNFQVGMIWSRSGVRTYGDPHPTPIEGPGIGARAARTGETQLVNDVRKDVDYIGPFMNQSTLSKLEESHQKGILSAASEWVSLSEIDVPIKIEDQVIGVLNAESVELNAFTTQDQELLEILASHVASSIQRIRLLEEQIQYEIKLEALHVHASKLADAGSIEEVSKYTLKTMAVTLGFDYLGSFCLVKDDHLHVISTYGYPVEEAMSKIPIPGPGVMNRVISTGKAQLVTDIKNDPDHFSTGDAQINSELDVPVIIDEKVTAILNTESDTQDAFNEDDQKLLEILASHVASAIQRIRLLEEQIQYEAKLEALHVHTSKLADAGSIDEIADYTVNAMNNTLGYQFGLFMLLEGDRLISLGLLGEYIARGYSPDPIPLDVPGITTRTAKTGMTQLVNDTRLDHEYRDAGVGPPSLSELDVPIKIEDKVIGILNVESVELNAFTEQDKNLLEILASHVASSIQRIRLLEEQIQYEEQLEERAKKLEALNKDLEKEIQTRKEYEQEIIRVARESEIDRLRSQFLSTITHELRTPLTSIKGYIEVIRSGWVGDITTEMNETLDIIIRNTDRLSALTSDLLDIQRMASGRLEVDLANMDLTRVIEQSVKEIDPVLAEKKQLLELEIPGGSIEIMGDSQRLNQVLMNLLNNASKFSKEETSIQLKVETDDEKILVSVKDSGIGIKEADLERVFTPLAMIEKPIYVKGTGLGLSISKGLIDLHNGKIWAESEGEWKGSTFTIQLPKGGEA